MTIRKLPSGGYRLYSASGGNLGTFPTRAKAEKHEREVQFFKHAGEAPQLGWYAEITYDGPADVDFERKLNVAFGDQPSFVEREEVKGVMRHILNFNFTTEADAQSFAHKAHGYRDGISTSIHGPKTSGGAVTVPRGAPPRSVKPEADKTSLEYFAASFFSGVAYGGPLEWREFISDPRVAAIAKAIRGIGYQRIARILGNGSFGTAALDEGGGVLKLTSDPTEVAAGAVLRGMQLPHVVFIAGAWKVKGVKVDAQSGQEVNVGLLSMQAVKPLPRDAGKSDLSSAVFAIKDKLGAHPEDLDQMTPGKARMFLSRASATMIEELRYEAQGRQLFLDVASALEELREHRVFAIDVHGGNVGLDEGGGIDGEDVYRVYDIGTSSSPRMPIPIAFERGARRPSQEYAVPVCDIREI